MHENRSVRVGGLVCVLLAYITGLVSNLLSIM
jgi:hypothetical protein